MQRLRRYIALVVGPLVFLLTFGLVRVDFTGKGAGAGGHDDGPGISRLEDTAGGKPNGGRPEAH